MSVVHPYNDLNLTPLTSDVDRILIRLERMEGSLSAFQLVKVSNCCLFHYPSTECVFSSHSIGLVTIFAPLCFPSSFAVVS